jgi:hypothetical protein
VRPGTGLGSAGLARCPCAAKGGGRGADCESPAHSDRVEETADGQRTQCHAAERAAEEEAGLNLLLKDPGGGVVEEAP